MKKKEEDLNIDKEKNKPIETSLPPVEVSFVKKGDSIERRGGVVARIFDGDGNLREQIRIAG